MSMVIAIDYDGTIGNTNQEKANWILAHLGRIVSPWDCDRTNCVPIIGLEAYEAMGEDVFDRERTIQANEVPGALDALRRLAIMADLFIVTARAEPRLSYAREWLASKGVLPCIKDIRSSKGTTKAAICAEIGADMLIDDDARHVNGIEANHLCKILLQIGRREKPELAPGVIFCGSWQEVLAIVGKIG
jgi:hypothetical protein